MIEAREDLKNQDQDQQQDPATSTVETTPDGKVKLTVTGILEDLDNGLDNKAMAAKYGLTVGDIVEVRKHPKLKNKRRKTQRKKTIKFVLEDDTTETETPNAPEDAEDSGLKLGGIEDSQAENDSEPYMVGHAAERQESGTDSLTEL